MKNCYAILTEKQQRKMSALPPGKFDKYEYLIGKGIQPPDQRRKKSDGTPKVCRFAFRKSIWKTNTNKIRSRRKTKRAVEEHGKQLVKSSNEKECSTHSKQKEIFEVLANEKINKGINEVQNLSKQTDFNNLIYYLEGESAPKSF